MSINKNSQKTPNLRFKGFTDDWEQRKLGGVVEFYSGLTYSPDNIIPKGGTFVLRSSNVKNGELINADNVYVDSSFVNSSNVQIGDIVVVVRNGSRNLIGKHAQVKNYMENTVIGAFMTGIRAKEPNYINALLNTQQFKIEINKNLGATINQITIGAFKKMQFLITPNVKEQTKIGSLFNVLDKTITLHQRKLDQLNQLKEALLQQMFPGKGETVPRLRFAGFEGDWEQRKLGDVLTVSKEKNKSNYYSKEQVLSVSREVGTVNQIEYQGRSFAGANISGYKIVYPGQLIYTKSPLKGAPYGIFQLVTEEGIVSPLYAVYNSTEQALASFIGLQLKSDNIATHYLSPLVSKGAKNTINITDEGALDGRVTYPTITEQQKIVVFFKQLDNTITVQQRKLEQLQNMKHVLLQNMFI